MSQTINDSDQSGDVVLLLENLLADERGGQERASRPRQVMF
jgi:hypothetical protein